MRKKPLKKIFLRGSQLNFDLLSFAYDEENKTIQIRTIDRSYRDSRKNVTSFRIRYDGEFRILDVNGLELFKWIDRKDLRKLVKLEARKILEQDMKLKGLFPQTDSYEVESNLVRGHFDHKGIDFIVWVLLTIHFSREVPFEEFIENFWNFVRESFTERGFFGGIVRMIKLLVLEDFPDASISVTTGPSAYKFYFGERSSSTYNLLVDIFILLKGPLPERIVETLLNSSDVREFVFKFIALIEPSRVENVFLFDPEMRKSDLDEVKKLLSEVSSFASD